jgi:uncharacterized membrane protein
MSSKKYISPLVCGFGASVLSIVPGFKAFACCLIVPLAAFFSLWLDRRINKISDSISSRQAVTFGLLTGLFSALFITAFDILITFLTHSNDFAATLPQTEALLRDYNLGPLLDKSIDILKKMAEDIKDNGFSALYSFAMLISNLMINTVFGLIGGLLGMSYINKRQVNKN